MARSRHNVDRRMNSLNTFVRSVFLASFGASLAAAQDGAPAAFDARAAEHLLNRAGFGANDLEIARFARLGREAAIASLFEPLRVVDPFFVELDQGYREMRRAQLQEDGAMSDGAPMDEAGMEARRDEQRKARAAFQRADRRQMTAYTDWWLERLIAGDDPLRDRMTLFWSGLFTSSFRVVKSSSAMIEQHTFLRDNALGSYATLLRGIARDPAMLQYLDNASNKKREPNENFARELLELFTLGEGHYSEADIVAAARAFTGWTDRDGEFVFQRRQHDDGEKTFLGVTGNLDGDDVIDIILKQPRCAEHVAGRLLAWFEGRPASEERVREYGALLLASDYEVRPLLEKLFVDPAFEASDVAGQRIASPIDFLVGHARRLGVDPAGRLVALASGNLGEMLFEPPSVKGWDGGRTWIDTQTIMQRGNLAGVLVGTIGASEFVEGALAGMERAAGDAPADGPMMEDGAEPPRRKRSDELSRLVGRMEEFGWRPNLNLTARLARAGATTDAAVVDRLATDLLAVELSAQSRAELLAFLAEERAAKSLPDDLWTDMSSNGAKSSEAEPLARRLAHLMLSLPEAQLN